MRFSNSLTGTMQSASINGNVSRAGKFSNLAVTLMFEQPSKK